MLVSKPGTHCKVYRLFFGHVCWTSMINLKKCNIIHIKGPLFFALVMICFYSPFPEMMKEQAPSHDRLTISQINCWISLKQSDCFFISYTKSASDSSASQWQQPISQLVYHCHVGGNCRTWSKPHRDMEGLQTPRRLNLVIGSVGQQYWWLLHHHF